MKMFHAACLLLCFAGFVHMQKVKEACGTGSKCDADLVCQDMKCKAKIEGTCTKGSTDECVMTAAVCPDAGKCACPASSTADPQKTVCTCTNTDHTIYSNKCVSKVGKTCTADPGCVANADCNTTCSCKDGFVANADATMCLKKVDGSCSADKECLTNGMCSGNKCACKANYTATFDMNMCKMSVGQTCTDNADCGENAMCSTARKCVCKANYASKDGMRCGMKSGATCSKDSECVPNAMCKSTKCECQSPYTADSDMFCSGASAGMVSMVLLLAALVMSRWI